MLILENMLMPFFLFLGFHELHLLTNRSGLICASLGELVEHAMYRLRICQHRMLTMVNPAAFKADANTEQAGELSLSTCV